MSDHATDIILPQYIRIHHTHVLDFCTNANVPEQARVIHIFIVEVQPTDDMSCAIKCSCIWFFCRSNGSPLREVGTVSIQGSVCLEHAFAFAAGVQADVCRQFCINIRHTKFTYQSCKILEVVRIRNLNDVVNNLELQSRYLVLEICENF
ncbi:MAG: hypothetical protein MJY47_05300 [Fibrobacter sp.]|nr:hypothetical protein [Fibrobacter sp.]